MAHIYNLGPHGCVLILRCCGNRLLPVHRADDLTPLVCYALIFKLIPDDVVVLPNQGFSESVDRRPQKISAAAGVDLNAIFYFPFHLRDSGSRSLLLFFFAQGKGRNFYLIILLDGGVLLLETPNKKPVPIKIKTFLKKLQQVQILCNRIDFFVCLRF